MNIKEIAVQILSEPGQAGTLSWGRCASTFALVASIAWVSHVLFKTHSIPDLTGVTSFTLAPYGSNKLITMAQSFSSNPVNIGK